MKAKEIKIKGRKPKSGEVLEITYSDGEFIGEVKNRKDRRCSDRTKIKCWTKPAR